MTQLFKIPGIRVTTTYSSLSSNSHAFQCEHATKYKEMNFNGNSGSNGGDVEGVYLNEGAVDTANAFVRLWATRNADGSEHGHQSYVDSCIRL